jgi:methylmalonyl-CoA carboxyltransferase 12S subunit
MSERQQHEIGSEIETLRQQLERIAARLAELEGRRAPGAAPEPGTRAAAGSQPATESSERTAPAAEPAPHPIEIPEETVAAIAAAVAAFLGERVRVRQIRLISSPMWAQQGRVSIQASHTLVR